MRPTWARRERSDPTGGLRPVISYQTAQDLGDDDSWIGEKEKQTGQNGGLFSGLGYRNTNYRIRTGQNGGSFKQIGIERRPYRKQTGHTVPFW